MNFRFSWVLFNRGGVRKAGREREDLEDQHCPRLQVPLAPITYFFQCYILKSTDHDLHPKLFGAAGIWTWLTPVWCPEFVQATVL